MKKKTQNKDYKEGYAMGRREVCKELLSELACDTDGPVWEGMKFTEHEYHKYILLYIRGLRSKNTKQASVIKIQEKIILEQAQVKID